MLSAMEDPSAIGPAMIALLTTLYGAFMANVFFLPIADKLACSEQELFVRKLMLDGTLAIGRRDEPKPTHHAGRQPCAQEREQAGEGLMEEEELPPVLDDTELFASAHETRVATIAELKLTSPSCCSPTTTSTTKRKRSLQKCSLARPCGWSLW